LFAPVFTRFHPSTEAIGTFFAIVSIVSAGIKGAKSAASAEKVS
jgi:hypothetical protein